MKDDPAIVGNFRGLRYIGSVTDLRVWFWGPPFVVFRVGEASLVDSRFAQRWVDDALLTYIGTAVRSMRATSTEDPPPADFLWSKVHSPNNRSDLCG